MRLRYSLFSLACVGLIGLVGCGATGISALPGSEKSVFEGSYSGAYQDLNNKTGTMTVSIAQNAVFIGTITDTATKKTGPLTGTVRQDGHFQASYHYTNETTVYSGTGIMTQPVVTTTSSGTGTTATTVRVKGFSGTWDLTTPTTNTLTFGVSGETSTN